MLPSWLLFMAAFQDAPVTITVLDGERPIFARVVIRNAAGETVGSTGYATLAGRFVPPEGWKVPLPKGKYALHADAGNEFFAHDEEWTFGGEADKRVALRRWLNLRREGWHGGGDHNHLTREGSESRNEGFRLPGVAENDTAFGRPDPRLNPHVTYTHVPDMGAAFDLGKLVEAMAAGRNVCSSGAFATIALDGKHRMGDTIPSDGKEHELEVRAWATSDPADSIRSLEIVADGRVLRSVAEAAGKREVRAVVRLKADGPKWILAKVLCQARGGGAITNPIYFRKPGEPGSPEPLKGAVSGRVTAGGQGVPAEIVVSAWGKEVARSKAGADGAYRLEGVPLAAYLRFSHGAASAGKVLFFDDPGLRDLHHRIYATEFVGAEGSFAGGFPRDIFERIRAASRALRVDAELGR